jgi:hypothetical protein
MKKRKTPFRPTEKKTPNAVFSNQSKRSGASSSKKTRTVASPGEPEVRRAIPLDYVTTEDVELRSAPDFAASKLPGSLLGKGTVVKIAPQDWWYVEAKRPATASGLLRGWLPNALLRRATAAKEIASPPSLETPTGQAPSEVVARAELRAKMAKSIVNFEARRDAQGHLRVYNLPAGDGGGRYEVAGINDRYHPQEAAKLRDLINAGRYNEAENYATEVIAEYTDVVSKWTSVPEIEAYLRDCVFNRGPGGAAKILQMALGVNVDGGVGPETLSALRKAESDPARLLTALRVAREQYELRVVGRRDKFWPGLVNRWNKSLDFARTVPS